MDYSVRGGSFANMYGSNPGAYYSNDNYGRIVEGNFNNSYGPFVDPELRRHGHRRSVVTHRRRRGNTNYFYGSEY